MNNEQWRTISEAPDYAVSDYGRVKRIALSIDKPTGKAKLGGLIKGTLANVGYMRVCLRSNGWSKHFTIHTLVAAAFIGERPIGAFINHIDGDKLNNRLDNLEYVTPKENLDHAFASGLIKSRKGERNTILTNEQRAEVINKHQGGMSYQSLAKEYHTHYRTIQRIVRGITDKKDGIDARKKLTDLDVEHMRGWNKCGFSVASIARAYDLSYPYAWNVIHETPKKPRRMADRTSVGFIPPVDEMEMI